MTLTIGPGPAHLAMEPIGLTKVYSLGAPLLAYLKALELFEAGS